MSEESTKATIEKRAQEIAAGLPPTTAIGYTPEEAELSHAIEVEGASALRAIEQRIQELTPSDAELVLATIADKLPLLGPAFKILGLPHADKAAEGAKLLSEALDVAKRTLGLF